MKLSTSFVAILILTSLQIILGQKPDVKVTCYAQYCEQNEETEAWECETSKSTEKECELKNVCMESQLPSAESFIQQGCKFEGFLDDEDDAKIQQGETVCDEGYCYCKTNLCNNKNFKMPENYSLKGPKGSR